jgi:hypothetical protein
MHFIVETVDQIDHVPVSKECYVNIISNSDLMHPALSYPSLVYYRGNNKGFIFCIDHCESFSIEFELIKQFILKHEKIYCINAKYHKYFLDTDKLIDINFTLLDQGKQVIHLEDKYTSAHQFFYRRLSKTANINKIIPISKHYEMHEQIYNEYNNLFGKEENVEFYKQYVNLYQEIESNGIKVEKTILDFFEIVPELSVRNGVIYSLYNLYNTTCRATNSFNNINFLALNKENGCREPFVPKNDVFLEFDFDSYHLRLIANLIGYEFKEQSIHKELGKYYFGREELTEDEYNESKKITFQNIYGGVKPEYMDIPFFQKMNEYIYSIWGEYISLPSGRKIRVDENMNPLKAFNYCIQNLETLNNVKLISQIIKKMKEYKSKIILVVYDSFLIDFDLEEGGQILSEIKKIIESNGHYVKVKYGDNYNFLGKSQYL